MRYRKEIRYLLVVRFRYNLWNNYEYIWIKYGLFTWRQIERIF